MHHLLALCYVCSEHRTPSDDPVTGYPANTAPSTLSPPAQIHSRRDEAPCSPRGTGESVGTRRVFCRRDSANADILAKVFGERFWLRRMAKPDNRMANPVTFLPTNPIITMRRPSHLYVSSHLRLVRSGATVREQVPEPIRVFSQCDGDITECQVFPDRTCLGKEVAIAEYLLWRTASAWFRLKGSESL